MKKLLLSLVCLAGFAMANATEVKFDFTANDYGMTPVDGDVNDDPTTKDVDERYPDNGKTFTYEGVSITLDKLEGNGARYWKAGEATFRVNQKSGITVAAPGYKITSITFTGSTLNKFTVAEGTYNTTTHIWTGSAESVQFKNSSSTAKIKTMTVVFSVDGTPSVDPEPEPDPEAVDVASVAATKAVENDTKVKIGYELTVGFVNKSNVFACDAAGDFIQLYGANTLKIGDKIPAGWDATYKLYNDVAPELVDFTLPAATEGTFTPKVFTPDEITIAMVNSVIMVEDVTFEAATPAAKENFTGKVGETELSLRNNYTLESQEAGTYNINVVVNIFNNAPSLYVIKYVKTSGIANIAADDNAPVEYFNLHGVRVDNPANGIYIRRQGTTVTKVAL